MRPGSVVLAAVVIGLGAAGCGSSSSSSSSKLTKAQFVAKANAICAHGNTVQNQKSASLGKSPSSAQVTSFVNGFLVPNIQGQINAVRALGNRSADAGKVDALMNKAQADLNRAKANPSSFQSNTNPFSDFAAQAHAYGLTQCAPTS